MPLTCKQPVSNACPTEPMNNYLAVRDWFRSVLLGCSSNRRIFFSHGPCKYIRVVLFLNSRKLLLKACTIK